MSTERALITWLLMIPVAFVNGTLRQFGYAPYLGDAAANQISCFTAMFAFALLVYAVTRKWPFTSHGQARAVGLSWAAATVIFEASLGLSRGMPWRDVFAQYAIWNGQLWALVVVLVAMLPSLSMLWDRWSANVRGTGSEA